MSSTTTRNDRYLGSLVKTCISTAEDDLSREDQVIWIIDEVEESLLDSYQGEEKQQKQMRQRSEGKQPPDRGWKHDNLLRHGRLLSDRYTNHSDLHAERHRAQDLERLIGHQRRASSHAISATDNVQGFLEPDHESFQ
ncbi:hypothetical protein KCU61_g109, partial [Aureobasidium melanogenum]